MKDWIPKFVDEKMDLEALMLLTESDLGNLFNIYTYNIPGVVSKGEGFGSTVALIMRGASPSLFFAPSPPPLRFVLLSSWP